MRHAAQGSRGIEANDLLLDGPALRKIGNYLGADDLRLLPIILRNLAVDAFRTAPQAG